MLFSGHEYLEDNRKFNFFIDPKNTYLSKPLLRWAAPTTLFWERKHNVFLRYNDVQLQKSLNALSPMHALAIMRRLKDENAHLNYLNLEDAIKDKYKILKDLQ